MKMGFMGGSSWEWAFVWRRNFQDWEVELVSAFLAELNNYSIRPSEKDRWMWVAGVFFYVGGMHAAIRNGESSTDGPRGSGLARTSGDFKPAGLASQTCELVPAHVSPDAVAIKPCTGAAVASGGAQARAKTAKSIGSVYSECVTSFSLNSWFFLL